MGLDTEFRYLRLIRHGKSADGRNDHQRPLNRRGKTNGAAMQQWFAAQPHPPEWVWSSDAVRAHSTAEFVAAGCGAELTLEPGLYLADAQTILDCIRATPPSVRSVALVAHNPGITYCANLLGAAPVTDNMVTFATACLRISGDWSQLAFGSAQLLSLDTPATINPP